ncbi:transposase [Aeromonas sp. 164P]
MLQDRLLRNIDKFRSFGFIRDKVRHCDCQGNGRPAIDPVLFFKMLFIGYLFGIRSKCRLVQEIHLNVAYRWFLPLRLSDKIIDASSVCQTPRHRVADSSIHPEIFDEIVNQAMNYRMLGGRVLYTDSTHLKANANKKKLTDVEVTIPLKAYLEEREQAIDEDRKQHGNKPLRRQVKAAQSEPPDAQRHWLLSSLKKEGHTGQTRRCAARLRLLPAKQNLALPETNGEGDRRYASVPDRCLTCPLRAQCTRSKKGSKQLSRHVWQQDREWIALNRLSDVGQHGTCQPVTSPMEPSEKAPSLKKRGLQ